MKCRNKQATFSVDLSPLRKYNKLSVEREQFTPSGLRRSFSALVPEE
jgi:hypothetical protein